MVTVSRATCYPDIHAPTGEVPATALEGRLLKK